MKKHYKINEIFYSLQGEGARAGTANLFLRFSNCNLRCNQKEHGFDCDTEFTSGESWTADEIITQLKEANSRCQWIILTGGEPSLQIDEALIDQLRLAGFKLAIETNGTSAISEKIDWVCVSPKTAEHTIKQLKANEVKYVRSHGMGIPKTNIKADHYFISPAFEGDQPSEKNIQWCIDLVKRNPSWQLSLQMHKLWGLR